MIIMLAERLPRQPPAAVSQEGGTFGVYSVTVSMPTALPIRGRGASENPPNRFEQIEIERSDWTDEDPLPETRFLRDKTRSIIAYNDSPDVGFDASVNPYRGCEHGCVYCVDADTLILLADGSTRPISEIRVGDEIYGTRRRGHHRRYVRTRVRAHWATDRTAYRVTLADGTELVASGDHRFLTWRGWKHVTGADQGRLRRPHLTPNDRMLGIGRSFIRRKRDIEGRAVRSVTDLRVRSIEPLGETRAMFDITTGTSDFIADGVVSHNCYARPNHEFLGMSAGLDFETRILVKEDAPALLRKELSSPKWKPQVLALSGVTDPYQPIERRLKITRGCLEVLAEARNPVGIITKRDLVTRDIDLLGELASHDAAAVTVSVTTLDRELQRVMEPRASVPERRLEAIRRLSAAGIPVGVNVAPVIPGLTDHELPAILEAAAEAGAIRAGFIMLRLPHGVAELFETWLGQHLPDRRDKVLNRLLDLRGGRLYRAGFGQRMRGEGPFAQQVQRMFAISCDRLGLERKHTRLSTAAFRRPLATPQLGLFD